MTTSLSEPLTGSQLSALDTATPTISRRTNLYNDCYGLPTGWNSFKDRYGRNYYVNFGSGVSQWENPISNQIDKKQHTDQSWPKLPPSIDQTTPYYIWFLGNNIAHPSQYWYDEEDIQPLVKKTSADPLSSQYWHQESRRQYSQISSFLTQDQIDNIPMRSITKSKQHSNGFGSSLAWVMSSHILLSALSCIMYLTVTGFTYPIMKAMKIDSWLPWTKYTSPAEMAIFCLAYLIYFILFILPNAFCCFPWLCGCNCGWARWYCCNILSLDVISPMKYRMMKKSSKTNEILDRIDQFQRDIPVLSVISESYHYPVEDCHYDSSKVNASDYDDYTVSEANHGSVGETFKRRSSVTYNSGLTSVPSYTNSNNNPILSYRSRRLVPITRFKDISVPSSIVSSSLLAQSHNLYDVVEIEYSNRFELNPTQISLLDTTLREYYYYNFTNDLHCDVHLQYLLGPQSESILAEKPIYKDILFTNDQGGEKNGKKWFKFCFGCGGIMFFIALWTGLYIFALTIWKRSTITYTHHNVKYLHLAPLEAPEDDEIDENGQNNNQNNNQNNVNSTTNDFSTQTLRRVSKPNLSQLTRKKEEENKVQGKNEEEIRIDVLTTTTTTTTTVPAAVAPSENSSTSQQIQSTPSISGTGGVSIPPPPSSFIPGISTNITPSKRATVQLQSQDPNIKTIKYKIFDQVLFTGPRARTEGGRPDHHRV